MVKVLAALATALWLSAGAAFAQTAPTRPVDAGDTGTTVILPADSTAQGNQAQVQKTGPIAGRTIFKIFGVPVRLGAPVSPSYEAGAYETFAGQPKTSLDNVLSQSAAPPPQPRP